MKGCIFLRVLFIDICPRSKKQLHNLNVPVAGSTQKGCITPSIHICPRSKKQLHNLNVAVAGSTLKGCIDIEICP
ncbi:hypothetical protein BDZ91DRAFT_734943 [Kalaharituber pfeilii]|nr:hypothetical protein BDZ91DRAFT_734943 [Kalaharituber pfeilii]